jgi:hypothetical protein
LALEPTIGALELLLADLFVPDPHRDLVPRALAAECTAEVDEDEDDEHQDHDPEDPGEVLQVVAQNLEHRRLREAPAAAGEETGW